MAFLIIGFFSLAVYLLYIVIFHFGYRKRSEELSYRKHTISVVIAARNEEENIGRLLTSLVNQSYSMELYEVLVVDDRSTDRTAEIVDQFSEKWAIIKLIRIEEYPESYSPKKYALSQAISQSSGEIILLTDADCLVSKYWIESMVSNFRDDISMVAGFSRIHISNWKKSSLLNKFEYFDFLMMFMAAAGAILSGRYFSCSNQNLAYRRKDFLEVGGFEKIKHLLSGDDVNLMQLFRKKKKRITFSLIKHSFVYTRPVNSFRQLISQRSRWASNAKWQLKLNPQFFFYLAATFMLHLSILLFIMINWQVAIVLFAARYIGECSFVSRYFSLFEQERKRLTFFPLWSVLQPIYIMIVTVMGLLNLFAWKPEVKK